MKIRTGFVSNSSSSSYVISNLTDNHVYLTQFIEENEIIIERFNEQYGDMMGIDPSSPPREGIGYTVDDLLKVANCENIEWMPREVKIVEFGDNDGDYSGTPVGYVFDYMLRDGGKSKSFKWRLYSVNH